MKLNRNIILSGFVLGGSIAAGSAQAVTLQSLGYAIASKQPLKATFAEDMKKGTKLTQDDLGCTWASRPTIYAFDDAVVFVAAGGTDYNAFTTATALSKGCWLPAPIAKKSGYSGILPTSYGRRAVDGVSYSATTMGASGMPVPQTDSPIANAIPPANFKQILENGVQLTQKQMNCTWAALPYIYAYADGVVFTNNTGSTYNAYSLDQVRNMGCWLPSSIIEGGPGDADVNTNGETAKEEITPNYIDTHNGAELCVGRWRWTETRDEGEDRVTLCPTHPEPFTLNVIDIDKGSTDGFPGVTKSLSTQVLTEDLGIAEATTRTTDGGSASINNDAKTLQECNARVNEWARTKSFGRTVVNGWVVQGKPEYAGLFQVNPINVSYNKVTGNSPVTQGAKCTDSKFGGCVAYSNKRHCQVNYQNDYYTVNYKVETRYNTVQDDPTCQPGKVVHFADFKSYPGQSKLNATKPQIELPDNSFVEITKNAARKDYVCSSGVHFKEIKPKYEFLSKYINDNKSKPDISKDPEFIAAVSTFWALLVEKSDKIVDIDAMGLANIEAVHKLFPTATFIGQSDADLEGTDMDGSDM